MSAYQLKEGDYVEFKRIVLSAQTKVAYKQCPDTGRAIAQSLRPEQILPQPGAGIILKLAKNERKVKQGNKVHKVHTGRVDAGMGLGVVTAVLDDAVLFGKQLDLGMGSLFDVAGETTSMYGTDAKGWA